MDENTDNSCTNDDDDIIFVNQETICPNGKSLDPISHYKKEMLENGLEICDLEYLTAAYKNLEDVKFIKIHCTSCDKHLGSAPNELHNRYQHPLLKVLVCQACFLFYSSGDFEKDEDGSELYCRWCGEGGQVYCCTKCPYVFCKKCIHRNLGRGIASLIQNSENWMCFSCDKSQIRRHRATYWAIQKFSEEMIQKAKMTGNIEALEIDSNVCCLAPRKRTELYKNTIKMLAKRRKLNHPSSTSKTDDDDSEIWKKALITEQPEDEVICTPDIIPIDDSPPSSPKDDTPQEMLPYVEQCQIPTVIPGIPSIFCPTPSAFQDELKNKFREKIILPNTPILQQYLYKSPPVETTPTTTKLKVKISKTASKTKNSSTNYVAATPAPRINNKKTWFEQAVIDCAEVTEYISTKISNLSGVHSKTSNSENLMEDLHNTFQTYMDCALKKINKIKKGMKTNYQKECQEMFNAKKLMNPFAVTKEMDKSEDEETSNKLPQKSSNNRMITTENMQPEDFMFDMDVTNASDEEMNNCLSPTLLENEKCISSAPIETNESKNCVSSVSFEKNESKKCVSPTPIKENESKKCVSPTPIKENESRNCDSPTPIKENESKSCVSAAPIKENESKSCVSPAPIKENESKNCVSPAPIKENESKNCVSPAPIKENESKNCVSPAPIEENIPTKVSNDDHVENLVEPEVKLKVERPDNTELLELLKKIQEKYNIYEIFSKELLKHLSAIVVAENNYSNDKPVCVEVDDVVRKKLIARMQFLLKEAEQMDSSENWTCSEGTDEENLKEMSENEKKLVNGEMNQVEQQEKQEVVEDEVDIENILAGNIVLRAKRSSTTFDDEFSKFLNSTDNFDDTLNIAKELDIIPEYVEGICNRDNGSLSLPPDSISAISSESPKGAQSADVLLSSKLFASKQVGDNCVQSVDICASSAECKG